jgi:trans-AT polyketide synthase/acyltransferase/oxidoreductase domain-containing protein
MIMPSTLDKPILLDTPEFQSILREIALPFKIEIKEGNIGINVIQNSAESRSTQGITEIPAFPIEKFGDTGFRKTYGVRCAFYAGAMANGISSAEMLIALGKAGLMGSFGAAGILQSKLENAIDQIQSELPNGPYAFNLIHSPNEEALERNAVDIFLQKGVHVVEASAYLDLTPGIVYYRVAGLQKSLDDGVMITNRVIAKLSRSEVATKFMQPAPNVILEKLLSERKITLEQVELARRVPMADDITVEGDSGGHTDNRPLICLLPTMLTLRDQIQEKYHYVIPVRIGAAGGISNPSSVLGAFIMGAAYVVTGSVNQACIESGTSPHTKKLLSEAGMADTTMAPSADMFEMGVKVQVLKRGTLFPMRAQKLYETYTHYDSIDQIPADERAKLEKQIFQRDMESIWQDTVKFFGDRDPVQIERAKNNPKRKMALIFRWYLGLSSRWSSIGELGREMDYQIWCGPSIGSFNDWTKLTYLSDPLKRRIVDVTMHLFAGAAYQYRIQLLKMQGFQLSSNLEQYYPLCPLVI